MSEQPPLSHGRLWVTSAPHVHHRDSVSRIMWEVNVALAPALLIALWVFGLRGGVVIVFSILGAACGEAMAQKWFFKQPITLCDGSAILTGLLLAFCVPAAIPCWAAFLGGFIAIVFGKQVYGGLGQNLFNPAHVARAILLASWPVAMTTWVKPGVSTGVIGMLPDGVTGATPLGFAKETLRHMDLMERLQASGTTVLQHTFTSLDLTWSDLLIGTMPGSLGETSKVALLLGGLFLLMRGHISWHIPTTMMGTVFFGSWLYFGDLPMAFFHLLSGGLVIGALFMATDMVTSPLTRKGHLIFGIGCGLITLLIRLKGGFPEGVCYSILIMNAFVPLIDRFTVPKRFGRRSAALLEAKA